MVMPPPHHQRENRSYRRDDSPTGSRTDSRSDRPRDNSREGPAIRSKRSTGDGEALRVAALARRLTPRDRWLIRMLFEHRVLTTHNVHQLAFLARRTTQLRLAQLHQLGVVDRFQPHLDHGSAPLHFVLGPAGAAVLAAEHGLTPGEIGYRRDRVLTTAHYLGLAHTVAVNTFFTHLIHTTAPLRAGRVQLWWSEARCVRYFGHHIRPDGYAHLDTPPLTSDTTRAAGGQGRGGFGFFLEFDMGTENLARLAGKVHGYHALAHATGVITPVLVVLTRHGRERGARTALAHELAALPHPDLVPLATTAFPTNSGRGTGDGSGHGEGGGLDLAAPVWLPLYPAPRTPALSARDPGSERGSGRVRRPGRQAPVYRGGPGRGTLLDLAALWPAPPGPPPYLDQEPAIPLSPAPASPGRRARVVHLPAPAPHPPHGRQAAVQPSHLAATSTATDGGRPSETTAR